MGGRLLDWLGSGLVADLPDPVVDMPTRVVPGSTALYFSTDTQHLFVYDESGPAWFDIDMAAVTAVSTESLQDMIGAFIVNGAGITVTYDDVGNVLVIDCNVTQYTNEMAQDAIAALIAAGTHAGITATYDDATNTLSFMIQEASNTEVWGGTAQDKVITPKKLKDWRTPVALTDGATITMDGSTGVNFYVTLGGNRAFANPTNFNPGQFGVIHVTQDGTGSRTATFGSNFKFAGVSYGSNVLSTTAAAVDAIHYYVRADGTITCFIIKGLTGTPAQLKLDDLSNVNMTTPPTDGQVLTYDNATSKWKPAAAAGGSTPNIGRKLLVAMPALSGFTQVNITGTRSITETAGKAFSIIESSPAASPKIAGVIKAVPAAPYRIVFLLMTNAPTFNYLGWAFGFSDGIKFHIISNPSSGSVEEMTWTTFSARASDAPLNTRRPDFHQGTGHWYAIRDNNAGKVYFETSEDGVNFATWQVVTKSGGYLGSSGYTNAFVGLYSEASTSSGTDYPHSISIQEYDENGATRVFDA